jgi:hypothetical protein
LVQSLGPFRDRVILSENRDNMSSSFPIQSPFIPFSCFISLARNSSTLLNSGDSGPPCLIPDFQENSFSFSTFTMVLAIGFSYIAFYVLRYIPSIPSFFQAFI